MKLGMIIKAAIIGVFSLLINMFTVVLFAAIMALLVKWTWNYTVVPTFSLPVVNWLQAWCLIFLAGMLIKSPSK